jgi:hypothetical protein
MFGFKSMDTSHENRRKYHGAIVAQITIKLFYQTSEVIKGMYLDYSNSIEKRGDTVRFNKDSKSVVISEEITITVRTTDLNDQVGTRNVCGDAAAELDDKFIAKYGKPPYINKCCFAMKAISSKVNEDGTTDVTFVYGFDVTPSRKKTIKPIIRYRGRWSRCQH